MGAFANSVLTFNRMIFNTHVFYCKFFQRKRMKLLINNKHIINYYGQIKVSTQEAFPRYETDFSSGQRHDRKVKKPQV